MKLEIKVKTNKKKKLGSSLSKQEEHQQEEKTSLKKRKEETHMSFSCFSLFVCLVCCCGEFRYEGKSKQEEMTFFPLQTKRKNNKKSKNACRKRKNNKYGFLVFFLLVCLKAKEKTCFSSYLLSPLSRTSPQQHTKQTRRKNTFFCFFVLFV